MNVSLWGIKKGMTQIPTDEGKPVPVTAILITPNIIVQVKVEKNNDSAVVIVQSAFKECKIKNLNKPQIGHLKKNNISPHKHLKETRIKVKGEQAIQEVVSKFPIGSSLDVSSLFKKKDKVKIKGISKGKGFAGVIKRYGFSLLGGSHGVGPTRRSGGSRGGGRGTNQGVPAGKKMPGRMGGQQVSVWNKIIDILPLENAKNHVILVEGAVPGNKGGLINLCKSI